MTTFQITDPDTASRTLTYRIRSLAELGEGESFEVSRWAKFCESCFSYKPKPPAAEYFERHYYNDPLRDAGLVKVVEFAKSSPSFSISPVTLSDSDRDGASNIEWEIVASTRVFLRTISTGDGATILAGGIGEVCTLESHRRRSLSRILLTDAIETMERRGLQASLLHASPALQAVYERSGNYNAVRSPWSVVTVFKRKLEDRGSTNGRGSSNSTTTIRLASFPSDVSALQRIHQLYSESKYFGCIVRSKEYWNNYISKEIGLSLFVLLSDSAIVAWSSVREKNGRYQLQDFGVDFTKVSVKLAMKMLLNACISPDVNDSFDLHLPTAVLGDVEEDCDFLDHSSARDDDDFGWMYRPIQPHSDFDKTHNSSKNKEFDMVKRVESSDGIGSHHLIWPVDSF